MRVWSNPVLRRELKTLSRRRGNWLFRCGVLAMIVGLLFLLARVTGPSSMAEALAPPDRHRLMLTSLCIMQATLVGSFPAGTAALSIAGERERSTWDMLLATSIDRRELLLGKQFAVLAWMLISAGLMAPIQAALAVLANVPRWGWLLWLLVLALLAVTPSSIGLCCSAAIRSTLGARLAALAAVLALMIGSGILFLFPLTGTSPWLVAGIVFFIWVVVGALAWGVALWCVERGLTL